MADGELPGFAGLTAAGATPEEAWAEIRKDVRDPEVAAILAGLALTAAGRAVLARSRADWARHGLPPPWDLTEGEH